MNIGLCTISSSDRPTEKLLQIAAEIGFDGVEIWGKDHIKPSPRSKCRQILQLAAELGLEIPVYGSYLRPGSDSFSESLDREINIASTLNANAIRVWAGEQEYQTRSQEHWERTVDHFGELAERASSNNVDITVERHSGTLTNTKEGAEKLLRRISEPNVGLNWQPSFDQEAGTIISDAERLAEYTNNIHLQAVRAPKQKDRCALSDAYFDIEEVLNAFQEEGYDKYIELEFVTQRSPYKPAVAADFTFLQEIIHRVSK